MTCLFLGYPKKKPVAPYGWNDRPYNVSALVLTEKIAYGAFQHRELFHHIRFDCLDGLFGLFICKTRFAFQFVD